MFSTWAAERDGWSAYFPNACRKDESSAWIFPTKWCAAREGTTSRSRTRYSSSAAWVLINYYRDNPHCHQRAAQFATPAQLLSAEEWAAIFRDAGFTDVAHRRIPDPTPAPESYTGRWFRDAAQLRAFRDAGALLVHGTK